ncbi:MAG: hypothetical protein JWN41_639 [Thermoleophilia bacterium]|nr:hypothetical protein [Thermoleophilia bacterium]
MTTVLAGNGYAWCAPRRSQHLEDARRQAAALLLRPGRVYDLNSRGVANSQSERPLLRRASFRAIMEASRTAVLTTPIRRARDVHYAAPSPQEHHDRLYTDAR